MLSFEDASISIGKNLILKNISVSFEKEKITTIVGPNGCGKTTLLQTLNGMSNLSSGKVLLSDKSFFDYSLKERAKYLSFLPQFREKAPNISVSGLVEHGRFPYMGFSRKMNEGDKNAVKNALLFAGVYDYKDQMVSELSGGLQQRVYLAMQLAQDCPVMVLDEPMNHLDFPCQREMYELIKELKHKGKTIILVLHDLGRAMQISDRLIVMKDRRIVAAKTPEECLERGIIDEVFGCKVKKVFIEGVEHYVLV